MLQALAPLLQQHHPLLRPRHLVIDLHEAHPQRLLALPALPQPRAPQLRVEPSPARIHRQVAQRVLQHLSERRQQLRRRVPLRRERLLRLDRRLDLAVQLAHRLGTVLGEDLPLAHHADVVHARSRRAGEPRPERLVHQHRGDPVDPQPRHPRFEPHLRLARHVRAVFQQRHLRHRHLDHPPLRAHPSLRFPPLSSCFDAIRTSYAARSFLRSPGSSPTRHAYPASSIGSS
jgi:hypothetical protein